MSFTSMSTSQQDGPMVQMILHLRFGLSGLSFPLGRETRVEGDTGKPSKPP